MQTKLNCKGKIVKGTHAGWYVIIENHEAEEGGYLILMSNNEDFEAATEGFDQWVENRRNLEAQFHYYGWEIEWLDCM